ncbi:Tim44 domain-containing protein [Polyangium aurulentum]|uniref:Tim44 domain-containing protein n=1 Tax=Polyangium aurulentum TaxID=2567896 RepID=UPI00146CCBF7|nr:Tim44-like domain-containing protein [Polyangium aurulentum]UQA56565.1 39S ribosomal protein L45 [Polyangium aurulentum]
MDSSPEPVERGFSMFEILASLIGGVVVIGFASTFLSGLREGLGKKGWESGSVHVPVRDPRPRAASVTAALAELRAKDQHFSLVIFEDFLYSLYAETQAARGGDALDRLGAYLTQDARLAYVNHPVAEVRDVVIGAMRFEEIIAEREPVRRLELRVRFEVNYTEVSIGGMAQSYWVEEVWTLVRNPDVRSRPPEKARVLGCPSCGAPLDKSIGAKCGYCGVVSSPGELDWTVTAIEISGREERGPMLTGTTEEVGTDLPTVVSPDVNARFAHLTQKDPSMAWGAFQARVETIFRAFYEAWSSQDLALARPYLSDNLFQFQRYWVDAYEREGLRNVAENARIVAIHMARVVSDEYFDAITVRVYATCVDYTIDAKGDVVGGNRSKERQYSEYWTLIRGAERRGTPRADPGCPNCGAPIDRINMAGQCGHCNAHVTAGEYDWVLSRIEQDEAYGA